MNLRDIQDRFGEALNARSQTAEYDLLPAIMATPQLPAADRLEIYRTSVHQGHANALTDIFNVCEKLVGAAFFCTMAQCYFYEYTSSSPDAGDFGRHFPEFLQEYEHAKSLRYLPDVARLELAWYDCFCGAEYKAMDFIALGKAAPAEDILFSLPANAQLLQSVFPIVNIWNSVQDNFEQSDTVDLDAGADHVLVWRKGIDIFIESLSKAEYDFCQACDAGLSLGVIQEQFPSIDVNVILPSLTQRGILCDFSLLNSI